MPMLFNCLAAILFLLAYNSVYAAESKTYVKECDEECRKYPYVGRNCGGLCSRNGAQSLYCHLGCSNNAYSQNEYEQCAANCTGPRLSVGNCIEDCKDVTHNIDMCKIICDNDEESVLGRCLFYCTKQYPTKEECKALAGNGIDCENTGYRECATKCYEDDDKWVENH